MNDYPIVLAHGIARFDYLVQQLSLDLIGRGINLGLAGDSLHYFKGIARHLRNHGFDVYQSTVGFSAGVEARAADLKREIELALALRQNRHEKVHIIAHSMGGLDARHMIVGHEMAERVASLTTIGTPHAGTSFADWGIQNQGHQIIKILEKCIDLGGFADLTTDACRAFNQAAEAQEATNAVVYQAYASSEEKKNVFTPLQLSWGIINDIEGDNDGLVSLTSQLWQSELTDEASGAASKHVHQHVFSVPADHFNEVGWWDFNQLPRLNLFDLNFLVSVKNYEDSIKDVYLKIARDAQGL
jgi:triacylglycerol lipase